MFPAAPGFVCAPLGVVEDPPPEPPVPPNSFGAFTSAPPAPPPVEVIVVKPEPEIEEFEPLFPFVFEVVCAVPPSPTVTVITVPFATF